MNSLLIASNNQGKLKEIQALLGPYQTGESLFSLMKPDDLFLNLEVLEDGRTYAENAEKKAVAYCHAAGLITLADDSGLEVDLLNGKPGIHSARFSPKPNATDADRRAYLLEQLKGKPRPWRAHFHCTIAIAHPNGDIHFAEGICQGEIIPEEKGEQGFGYDPIFLIPEFGKTMAELSMEEKNRISHRARAVQAAIPILQDLFHIT